MVRDPFAEREVDPLGMVDEEPQRVVPRFLEGDDVDARIQPGQLLLKVLLGGVGDAWTVGVEALSCGVRA